jgi:hypothetical protein
MSDPLRCVKVRAAGPFSRSPIAQSATDLVLSRRAIFAKAALSELQLPSRPRARGLTICSTPRRNRPRRSFLRLTPIARHAPGRTRSFSSIRCLPAFAFPSLCPCAGLHVDRFSKGAAGLARRLSACSMLPLSSNEGSRVARQARALED